MNTKTTLTVVLLALALGVYFLVFETDLFDARLTPTREAEAIRAQQDPRFGDPLFEARAFEPGRVRSVRLDYPGRPTIEIERDGADRHHWTQVEPVRFPMRPGAISGVLERIGELRSTRTVEAAGEGGSLADLGLDPPRATVTLVREDGEERVLALGRRAGAGRAYLTLGAPSESRRVYIVGDELHRDVLDEGPREMRSRALPSVSPGAVRSVALRREGERIELVREAGGWLLASPVIGRADRSGAERVLRAFSEARIERFVEDEPDDLSVYGLDEPRAVLRVEAGSDSAGTAGDGEAARVIHTLSIGAAGDLDRTHYFAMYDNAPPIFTLGRSAVERLGVTVGELRDARLTPVIRQDVRRLAVERADQPPLRLVREGGAWAFGEARPGFALDHDAVDALLGAIFRTRAADYMGAPDAEHGEPPVAMVELTAVGQDEAERLAIYERTDDERLVVLREGEQTGYVVDREELSPLFDPVTALRDRTVLDLTEEHVAEVRVRREGMHPADYQIARRVDHAQGDADAPRGEWDLSDYEASAVRGLLDHLTPLVADRWLAEPAEEPAGAVRIDLTLADGEARTLTLDLDTLAARVSGEPMAFEISRSLADAAAAELRDTDVLRLEAEQITGVETGTLVIERDRAGRYAISGSEAIEERDAAALFNTLAALRAVYFIDPAILPDADPDTTLLITTTAGETHELSLWLAADAAPVARLDGETAFTLEPGAAANLTP